MIRWMCGVSLKEKIPSSELRKWVGVEAIGDTVRTNRLRWYGHVERKGDDDWVMRCTSFHVAGPIPPGRPRKSWQSTLANDMRWAGVKKEDTRERGQWRRAIRRARAHPAPTGNPP